MITVRIYRDRNVWTIEATRDGVPVRVVAERYLSDALASFRGRVDARWAIVAGGIAAGAAW